MLAFQREPGLACWVNLGVSPVELSAGEVVLASARDAVDDRLGPDEAAWLAT